MGVRSVERRDGTVEMAWERRVMKKTTVLVRGVTCRSWGVR